MARRDYPARRTDWNDRFPSPFRTVRDMLGMRGLDSLFDDFFTTPFFSQPAVSRGFPVIDVGETDESVFVKAELPGVDPKDVDVNVSDDVIELRGEVKEEREEGSEDTGFYRRERYYGTFERSIPLPVKVKQDEVKAQYKDGILSITLPKAEPSKPKARKVEIEVS